MLRVASVPPRWAVGGWEGGSRISVIGETIDENEPARTAYNQWVAVTSRSDRSNQESPGREDGPGAPASGGGIGGRINTLTTAADEIQRRRALLAVPIAVFKKFGDDQGGHWAALIAYYGFFSLFPLLLVFTTILGFVLQGNQELQERILESALAQFPIIGETIRNNLGKIEGSFTALAIGIVGSLWAGMGVLLTLQTAMDELWDVPRRSRPNFLKGRLRAFLALFVFGAAIITSSVLAGLGTTGGSFGWALRIVTIAATFVLNALVIGSAFRYLTVARIRWRDVVPGALLSSAVWMALLALGAWLVDRQLRGSEALYGFFGIVLGLLSWIYVGAQLMLLSAELNVVLARRLWPRSLQAPPLSKSDKESLAAQATEEAARPREQVHVDFDETDDGPGRGGT
ncbi:MAG TPA: YihY/virulence factor BrkB family protein [Actinomycetota bacterium]|nr:YihY/virulence factor BrkB family protein [Actinomycetota bacterium]